ncbi:MAG: CZB domain-containing protein [Gammaproteobacteria bacterium]|nr:CZB domain-containing protein [Gammaproteobacteria bacterium]MBI5616734.1 CZB domain-containing protein [Gammaproteobacteria bacterium]
MDLNQAIAAHSDWKLKLRAAITKKEKVDAVTLSADDKCVLGKWLHGDAKAKYSSLKSYTDCLAKHASFHREAGKVAQAINAGNYTDAVAMLNAGTTYTLASTAATAGILALKKDTGL